MPQAAHVSSYLTSMKHMLSRKPLFDKIFHHIEMSITQSETSCDSSVRVSTCGGLLADMEGDDAGDACAVLPASAREPGLDRISSSRFAASFSCRLRQ